MPPDPSVGKADHGRPAAAADELAEMVQKADEDYFDMDLKPGAWSEHIATRLREHLTSDASVERVARAIWSWSGCDQAFDDVGKLSRDLAKSEARAAILALISGGRNG